MVVEQVTCLLPVEKILAGGCPDETSGAHPLLVWTISGAWLKDTKKFSPSQKILGRGLANRWQENCPPSGKVLGRGA